MQDLEPEDDLLDTGDEADSAAFTVTAADADRRLDAALAALVKERGLSRTRVKALIEDGFVTLDGVPVRDASMKLRAGQSLTLIVPPVIDAVPQGEDLPLSIAYEDEHLIVIDKPAGLVVHPAPGHASGTLVNALIGHCGTSLSGIGGVKRPGIVHRIDKDTSGLLVVAKTDVAHRGLSALFADHGRTMTLLRSYRALVWSRPERAFGTIEAPIGRHPSDRQRMAVVPEARGRQAITHWRLDESFGPDPRVPVASLVTCVLETGRTHQIRVHMAHIGHPLIGDPLYARGFHSKRGLLSPETRVLYEALDRQALHAAVLGFEHPVTGAMIELESPLPADFTTLLDGLRGAR